MPDWRTEYNKIRAALATNINESIIIEHVFDNIALNATYNKR